MGKDWSGLTNYIPNNALPLVANMLVDYPVQVVVTKERVSKHGDYRRPFGDRSYHKITVNGTLNKYAFLLTLVHEIAHMHTFVMYGKGVAPHGIEWKNIFANLALPLFKHGIWPDSLVPSLKRYFKNPKASSSASPDLIAALALFDESDQLFLNSLNEGSFFYLKNRPNQVFVKQNTRRTRVLCMDIHTKKQYAIHKMADVVALAYEK
jgi:hypothetical protein